MAASVGPCSVHELFLPDLLALDHGLERRSAATHFALMSSFGIVVAQPFTQIDLQFRNGLIDLLAECDLVKLLQGRLVEPLADTVGLPRLHLRLLVVDVIDCQESLEVVRIDAPAIFRPAISQNAQDWQVLLLVERQHPVVQQVSRRNRRFGGLEFGVRHLATSSAQISGWTS